METRRPYLTDVIRVPGLQTSLLLCRRVDVSLECTKLLVDKWLLFEFRTVAACQAALCAAFRLRHLLRLQSSAVLARCGGCHTRAGALRGCFVVP